jgi:hypothetical protein
MTAFTADSSQEWGVSNDAVAGIGQLWRTTDRAGGWIKATTDAADLERITAQLTHRTWTIPAATDTTRNAVMFETILEVSAITCDAYFGLAVAAATDPHASRPLGAVAFTLTNSANIEAVTANASTSTASVDTGADIVAATPTRFGIWCDGLRADFFVNGKMVYRTSTTIPAGLTLSPVFCIEANGAVAHSMSIDAVRVSQARIL